MKRTYITHITRDYIEIAFNLAKSIRQFSDISLIIYCVNLKNDDVIKFNNIEGVTLRNIEFDLEDSSESDYHTDKSGNLYVNRNSLRIYKILCIKTIAMQMALEEGWQEVCYLDSDCIATPIIDELFNWSSEITNYPLATQGIHQYVMFWENGVEFGNPFSGGSWPNPDNKLSLEWPLMNFLEMKPEQRGTYRTTNVLLMNYNCLEFIKTWKELCFILPKLVNVRKWAGFHEETIYNVLNWRETNKGLPLCYINLSDGLQTVEHFYSDDAKEGVLRWSDEDTSRNFYKIPDNKKHVKVLHGEKRTNEVNKILNFFKPIEIENREIKVLVQVDTYPDTKDKIEITKLCIESLKSLGYPILVTSHIEIPKEISDICDYTYSDNNNILLPKSGDISSFYYGNSDIHMSFVIEDMESHSPSVITGWLNGAKFSKENGFTHYLKVEYDFILEDSDVNKLKNSINDSCIYRNGFVLIKDDYVVPKIILCKTDIVNDLKIDISNSDDYLRYCSIFEVPDKNKRMAGVFSYYVLKNNFNKMNIYPSEGENYFKTKKINLGKFLGFFAPLIGPKSDTYLCLYSMCNKSLDFNLYENENLTNSKRIEITDGGYYYEKININDGLNYKLIFDGNILEFTKSDVDNYKYGKIIINNDKI